MLQLPAKAYDKLFYVFYDNGGLWIGGLKAFATIAESSLQIDLSCVLEQVIIELTTFLRKVSEFFLCNN